MRSAVTQSVQVLDRRLNALGTTEPSIQAEGSERILVQVPGLAGHRAAEADPRSDRAHDVPSWNAPRQSTRRRDAAARLRADRIRRTATSRR